MIDNFNRVKFIRMNSDPSFPTEPAARRHVAFVGDRCVADGAMSEVARAAAWALQAQPQAAVLVFDCDSGQQIDLDLRGTPEEAAARAAQLAAHACTPQATAAPRRGRPQLGVVAREVTLLPRHWEWLSAQPGGASVTLRRLVERALRASPQADRTRHAQERTYRFLTAIAGHLPGYEDALRALFGRDRDRFRALTQDWPADIARLGRQFADDAFPAVAGATEAPGA